MDRFAAGFARRHGLPVLQVGGHLDFVTGAFRNVKLELKRAIRKANAGVQCGGAKAASLLFLPNKP